MRIVHLHLFLHQTPPPLLQAAKLQIRRETFPAPEKNWKRGRTTNLYLHNIFFSLDSQLLDRTLHCINLLQFIVGMRRRKGLFFTGSLQIHGQDGFICLPNHHAEEELCRTFALDVRSLERSSSTCSNFERNSVLRG